VSASDLAALVAARFCHDLINPLGAIGNGLELMQMSPGPHGPELALVNESLATALAKLRFYRVAFGPADPDARLKAEEAAALTGAMYRGRFTVGWEPGDATMPRPVARLVFLAILCLERSLPMGGRVLVRVGEEVALGVEGRRTAPPEELWQWATEGRPALELKADGVQFALLAEALRATGHRIDARFSETGAALRLTAASPIPA
jgi:histidine phosphotransferase ChpT